MTIYTDTLEEMLDIVAGLVKRGLTFEVMCAHGYTITFTGGF